MLIIDGDTVNRYTAKSLMTKISYELCKEHDLYVIVAYYDGGYDVTISEREGDNPLVCSDEFSDDYSLTYAILDVLYELMNKIWKESL